MSQIRLRAQYEGMPVEIMAGWSRGESQVFVMVAALDDKGEWRDDIELGLEAWKDVKVRPTELAAAVALVMPIRDKLKPMGLDVPDKMLAEVAVHVVRDVDNVVVRYHEDGTREVLAGELDISDDGNAS